MADLSAASVEDVKGFFRKYYAPNNATITIAGDVKRDSVLAQVKKLFDAIPRGPAIEKPVPLPVTLTADTIVNLEDRVQLPRLDYAWHTTKAWSNDDAALKLAARILTGSKSARLTQRLVYEKQVASGVSARQGGLMFDGSFRVTAAARPGHSLGELQGMIDEELRKLAESGPSARELDLAKNATEAGFLSSIQTVSGKSNQLNAYYYQLGVPDGFQQDLDRYRAVTADDIKRVVRQYLLGPRVIIGVVPEGKLTSDLVARPRITP
jgi:zinc protease